jgi:hypothetical protein
MTDELKGDEPERDEHERSLADLLGFDPADERADDVPDAVGARVQALLTDAIGDEPEAGFSPLTVIAAARRDAETAARDPRRDRERADAAAEFARRRRRSTVTKGLLIAAAAVLVVVAVPTLLRSASSTNSASTVAASATTAAAGGLESGNGSDSAGGGQALSTSAMAVSSEAASSAAAATSAPSSAERSAVPAAGATGTSPASRSPLTSGGPGQQDSAGGTSAGALPSPESQGSTAGTDSGSATDRVSCIWPELSADATAAALRALQLPAGTPVQQPVRAVCASGPVGATIIPSAGVTVLVARDDGLTSEPQYGYSTARATATGDGISVLVLSTPPAGADNAQLSATGRAAVARAVLAAVQ